MRTSAFECLANPHGYFVHASVQKTHIFDQITTNRSETILVSGLREQPSTNYEQCKSRTGVMEYDNGNVPSNSIQCTETPTEYKINAKMPYARAMNQRNNNETISSLHEPRVMLNPISQKNTSVESVQNPSNYTNKILQRNSNTMKVTKSANNYHFTGSESIRSEYENDVPSSSSECCTNTVNCSIYKVRGKSRATCKWSNTVHNIHALFVCFALLTLGVQNTLVSANIVAPTMTLPHSDSSMNDDQPINMTTIIRNQISINGISTSENVTNPRRAGGSK